MKYILSLGLLILFTTTLVAQQKRFNIEAFGAVNDGTSLNTSAIQNAIDKASAEGGGKVIIPKGKFVTGSIYLKTGVELSLQSGAILLASTNRLDYGKGNAAALITAKNQSNISITGDGEINGMGKEVVKDLLQRLAKGEFQDSQWKTKAPAEANRPKIIMFAECDHILVSGITLKNGASWIQEYFKCNHVVIDKITVLSNEYWNNDGIDIVNSKNVSITNCNINSSDDAICLKSEGAARDSCINIYVANCKLRSSANAFKIGTGSSGGFKNIKVNKLEVYDTYRSAIAIEALDGAFLEDVSIQNVKAVNTGNAILIRLGHRNKDTVYSSIKNIHISNLSVQIPAGKPDKGYDMEGPLLKYPPGYKPSVNSVVQSVSPWNNSSRDSKAIPYFHNVFPSSITGLPNHPVENVTIENVAIIYETIADKKVNYFPLDSFNIITEAQSAYPEFSMFGELPVWGFYVRHVIGLSMKNITVTMKGKDFRNPFLFNDVKKLNIDKIKIIGNVVKPAIFYNEVTKIKE